MAGAASVERGSVCSREEKREENTLIHTIRRCDEAMGNRSSTPSSEPEGSSSGMYLTPELQGEIDTTFSQ
eukprot:scaffold28260_cov160-Skeletonema_menzelii.AAC.2